MYEELAHNVETPFDLAVRQSIEQAYGELARIEELEPKVAPDGGETVLPLGIVRHGR